MKNRQHSRLLTTLVLVAAVSFAFASEAFAAGGTFKRDPAGSLKLSKPSAGPTTVGEPDVPQTAPPPPPPLKLSMPRSGGSASDWALRVYWSLRVTLMQLPKRFP